MKIARVEYTVTRMGKDRTTVSMNEERIMSDLDSTDPDYIHQVLEQELQTAERPALGKNNHGSSLVVTNTTELKPTGDDDQM